MANKSESGQGSRAQMEVKMMNFDMKLAVENLLTKYADKNRRRAFADTKTAYKLLQEIYENPANLDNLDAVVNLSRCSELCNEAAELRHDFGRNAAEYIPHFEFNGPLEFKDESMDTIIGKDHAKEELSFTLILPNELAEIRKEPWTRTRESILVFGPRDSGKTHLVCAAVKQSKYPYVWVNNETVEYKWRERACDLMALLFEQAELYERCVIVLDGIDTMTSNRDGDSGSKESKALSRTLEGLLKTSRRISKNIIVVAIAHHPDSMDYGLLYEFSQKAYVPLPNEIERAKLFKLFISKSEHTITDEGFMKLAGQTISFSGYDIHQTVQVALHLLLGEIIENAKNKPDILQERHLMKAVGMSSKRNNYRTLWKFEKYDRLTAHERKIKSTNKSSCLMM